MKNQTTNDARKAAPRTALQNIYFKPERNPRTESISPAALERRNRLHPEYDETKGVGPFARFFRE